MGKVFLAYLFVAVYFLGMLKPIEPFIEFELRKDYIQEFLCINNDQPITVCGGSCFLSQKIKESQSENSSFPPLQFEMKDYPIGFVKLFELEAVEITKESQRKPYIRRDYERYFDVAELPPSLV